MKMNVDAQQHKFLQYHPFLGRLLVITYYMSMLVLRYFFRV
jgi:hypothetical protein